MKIQEILLESNCDGSNISVTGTEKALLQRKLGIRPGTPEWFRLWFARPYLTDERPVDDVVNLPNIVQQSC